MNIHKTLKIALICTLALIAWGAVVRWTHSGLGCPDWPLCHGEFFPEFERATYIELTHRIIAAIVGFLTLGACIGIWRNAELNRHTGKLATASIIMLVIQSVLGGAAVWSNLSPHVIAVHLGLGFIFLAVLTKIVLRVGDALQGAPEPSCSGSCNTLGYLALLTVLIQSFIGAIVSSSHAGLACPDFPTCLGEWWPAMEGLVAIHMTHRIGAIIATVAVLLFVKRYWSHSQAGSSMRAVLGLLCCQVALGIGNVLLQLPLVIDVAHLLIAASLFAMLVVAMHRIQSAQGLSQSHQAAH